MWSMIGGMISYSKGMSNHSMINVNNLYNFFIVTLEHLPDDQKGKYIENMKLTMGMTVFGGFRDYVFRKIPESPLFKYIK